MISRTAAPVGEVMTPTVSGNSGIGLLRSAANSPSSSSFFQLLKCQIQTADAVRLHMRRVKLVLTIAFVYRDVATGNDFGAFLRLEGQPLVMGRKHDGANPAALILQSKVHMPARMVREIRNFAANPHVGQQAVRVELHPIYRLKSLIDKIRCGSMAMPPLTQARDGALPR